MYTHFFLKHDRLTTRIFLRKNTTIMLNQYVTYILI